MSRQILTILNGRKGLKVWIGFTHRRFSAIVEVDVLQDLTSCVSSSTREQAVQTMEPWQHRISIGNLFSPAFFPLITLSEEECTEGRT